ncbi:hypothetical protein BC835DRAFT_1345183 [Cytidiella melzeri]|nr:hypothetical protein BC835DRAFT_1345183 [Cytidiella melzeri]
MPAAALLRGGKTSDTTSVRSSNVVPTPLARFAALLMRMCPVPASLAPSDPPTTLWFDALATPPTVPALSCECSTSLALDASAPESLTIAASVVGLAIFLSQARMRLGIAVEPQKSNEMVAYVRLSCGNRWSRRVSARVKSARGTEDAHHLPRA